MANPPKDPNSLEIPSWERPGYRPDESAESAEPQAPMDLEPGAEIEEAQDQKMVEGRRLEWAEAKDVLMTAEDPEALGRVAEITGAEISPDEAARLLSLPPHERLGILLRVPTLEKKDEEFLKRNEGLGRDAYLRQKGVLSRLKRASAFEVGPDGKPQFSRQEAREAKARMAFIVDMRRELEDGGFGALSPEEKLQVNELLTQALQVEEYIISLSGSENAQSEIYAALNDGGLSDEEIVARMVGVETKFALGPKDQEDHRRWAEESASSSYESMEATPAAAVMDELELNPSEVKVVGHNAQGDVILRLADESVCTVGKAPAGGFMINAVKVNILGKEFVVDQPERVNNGREFAGTMGKVRSGALLSRHGLPFRGPEKDQVVERFARATGEVQEFTYDRYATIENSLTQFLEALTPEGEQDQTRAFCQEVGVLDGAGQWDLSQWETIAKGWGVLRKVENPKQAHQTIKTRFGKENVA